MAYKTNERTISKELFDAWQANRRVTDVRELMEITGKSETVIYRALQFGAIKSEELSDTISNFYIKRSEKQQEQARRILSNE